MRDFDDIDADARPGSPFSNSTDGEMWMGQWCYRCNIDAPFQREESSEGCPLILIALTRRTPAEWTRTGLSDYTCAEFVEDKGDTADTHEGPAAARLPQPIEPMPGQLDLFEEC